jgi:hypothetical protein
VIVAGAQRGQDQAREEDDIRPSFARVLEGRAWLEDDSQTRDARQQEASVGQDIEKIRDPEQVPLIGKVMVREWAAAWPAAGRPPRR